MSADDPPIRLRDEALDWRMVDDEVVALDGTAGRFIGTNNAGALLWSLLAHGATRGELVEALKARYSIARDDAQRDVDAFLDGMAQRGLLAPQA